MKKFLCILIIAFSPLTVSAQAPFTTFRPLIVPQQSYSIPNISFSDPIDEFMDEIDRRNAAIAWAKEIISSEIITADGLKLD